MIDKFITLSSIVLLATTASVWSETQAAENAVSSNPSTADFPGLDRIKADAGHRIVFALDGLPVVRNLAASPSVHQATINSSVREGDLLKLSVTFLLTDQGPGEATNYMARSSMTYRQADGAWALQSMHQDSIRETGPLSQVAEDEC